MGNTDGKMAIPYKTSPIPYGISPILSVFFGIPYGIGEKTHVFALMQFVSF
jgi:hypothetical protein